MKNEPYLKLLKQGNSFYSNLVKKKQVVHDADYSKGIPCCVDINSNEKVVIPINSETRIGCFGASGSGKTLLAKSICSRAHKSGMGIFHGSDMKNDFQKVNSYGGASKRLQEVTQGLLKGEEPCEMERTLAIPSFLVQYYNSNPDSFASRFSAGFSDITISDFKYIMRYDKMTEPQKTIFEQVLGDLSISEADFDTLKEKIDEIGGKSRNRLKNKLDVIEKNGIIKTSMRSALDILNDLNNRGCVALGLKNYTKFWPNDMEKLRFYSALMLRNLKELLNERVIERDLLIFNDEFHLMAPNLENSPVKDEFQNILDTSGRVANISTMIAAQRPSQVPWPYSDDRNDFLGTLNHIFISENLASNDWKKVLQSTNLWDPHRSHDWQNIFRKMDKYQFLYINTDKHKSINDTKIVESLSPLCYHPVE